MNEVFIEDEEWKYGYEDRSWFDDDSMESRLAKYWASVEMAKDICREHLVYTQYLNWDFIAQLLKKEWFR